MTDTKYLDDAARLAGFKDWADACVNGDFSDKNSIRAHAATLEREANFRREVSEAVVTYNDNWRNGTPSRAVFLAQFGSFIIAKPDPLVEAVKDAANPDYDCASPEAYTEVLRAAIEARGGKIVWEAGE